LRPRNGIARSNLEPIQRSTPTPNIGLGTVFFDFAGEAVEFVKKATAIIQ
jgi:hypothetical protein